MFAGKMVAEMETAVQIQRTKLDVMMVINISLGTFVGHPQVPERLVV